MSGHSQSHQNRFPSGMKSAGPISSLMTRCIGMRHALLVDLGTESSAPQTRWEWAVQEEGWTEGRRSCRRVRDDTWVEEGGGVGHLCGSHAILRFLLEHNIRKVAGPWPRVIQLWIWMCQRTWHHTNASGDAFYVLIQAQRLSALKIKTWWVFQFSCWFRKHPNTMFFESLKGCKT